MRFRVWATREGLEGKLTATGHRIKPIEGAHDELFCALPSVEALGKWVNIYYKGQVATVPVLDLGPWNELDSYWKRTPPIPWAQQGLRKPGVKGRNLGKKPTNKAGIDLSSELCLALKHPGGDFVEWEFCNPPAGKIASCRPISATEGATV